MSGIWGLHMIRSVITFHSNIKLVSVQMVQYDQCCWSHMVDNAGFIVVVSRYTVEYAMLSCP